MYMIVLTILKKIQSFEASETNDLKSAMKKLNDRVEQNPVNFSEIVKQQVTESLEAVSDDLHDVKNSIEQTEEQAAEQRDKENRRNNIILYRVPESEEMRAEERNNADVAFCLQLFNNCLHPGITDDDLINVFRLGRNQDSDTPRPVMIQFAISKNLIMESLYRLKHAEQKFKGVVIAHNTTRTERDECKRLVAEAKDKENDDTWGEFIPGTIGAESGGDRGDMSPPNNMIGGDNIAIVPPIFRSRSDVSVRLNGSNACLVKDE